MTEEEFIKQYEPEETPEGNLYRQRDSFNKEDAEAIEVAQKENRVWSLIDEDGSWGICNWIARVNHVHCIITKNPYHPKDTIIIEETL